MNELTLKDVMRVSRLSRQAVLSHKDAGRLKAEPMKAKRFGLRFTLTNVETWLKRYFPEQIKPQFRTLFTTEQVAELIGKSPNNVRQLILAGKLYPTSKLCRKNRFAAGTFEHLAKKKKPTKNNKR